MSSPSLPMLVLLLVTTVAARLVDAGPVLRDSEDSVSDLNSVASVVSVFGVGAGVALVVMLGAAMSARTRKRLEREALDFDKPVETVETGGLSSDCEVEERRTSSRTSTESRGVAQWAADPELAALQVNARDLEDVRKLGSGAFGVVWLVRYRQTTLLAAKRFRTDELAAYRSAEFVQEIKLVARLAHPNIVRLVGVAWTADADLQALFEFVSNGDLREFLQEPSVPVAWSAAKLQIALDVAEALAHVHAQSPPLLHRDLKSRNILLTSRMRAKVADFGVSRAVSTDGTMTQGVGTGRWLAPEVLAGAQDYAQPADVFALGCVLFELDAHAVPHADARSADGAPLAEAAVYALVACGRLRPRLSPRAPPALRALVDRCVAFDPRARPTAAEAAETLRSLLAVMTRAGADARRATAA